MDGDALFPFRLTRARTWSKPETPTTTRHPSPERGTRRPRVIVGRRLTSGLTVASVPLRSESSPQLAAGGAGGGLVVDDRVGVGLPARRAP